MDYAKIIESKYNRQDWQKLLYNIFGKKIEFCEQTTKVSVDSEIAQLVSYIGKINLSDGYTIAIYEVELSDNVIIERNRTGIRNLLCTNWRGMGCAGAFMFCFRQNETTFRFSYVSESFVFAEDGTLKKESTDTKRFTYLLGEGHRPRTAIDRFEKLKTKAEKSELTLKDITEAFSVEALSNEFFKEYKQQYENIIKDLPKEKSVRDYVKKFMGRLVFIQFLQKKGWMGCPKGEGWSNGDPDFLQNLFENSNYKDTFVQDVLEPLFKDINTKRENDLVTDEKIGKEIKVPYLNGGLFEQDTQVFPLPYEKINEKIEDLLNFFSNYNFTIDENDPDDAEIGVDPEMLGRIFENLLEDNKDKGAFYTPKEIVQYMCRESLIAYLQTNIKEETTKEAIRQFVTTHHPEPIETIKQEIDKKLQEVKICDPAIGSGAFPMGMLKELFECRKAIEGIEGNKASEIKKEIIQQNIYGVDIEKGAVDIARLRFWLALIVDEDSPHILPNLDFKIMQGNSLLEQYKGVDLSKLHDIKKEEKLGMQVFMFEKELDCSRKELSDILEDYFKCNDQEEKKEKRKKIKENVQEQIKKLHYDNEENLNLNAIQDISATSEFFLWHTWFADVFDEKGGFDIVIGNPPYGANIDALIDVYRDLYPNTSHGYIDIYKYFFDCFLNILKNNGTLCYITPNTFLRQPRYKDIRKVLLKYNILQIIDLGDKIFEEPVVLVAITILCRCNKISEISFADLTKTINRENIGEILISIPFIKINQQKWKNTPNNIFIENYINMNKDIVYLDNILDLKDAGINYQRVKVGLSQKGKSNLGSRLLYEGECESNDHIEYFKGEDIKEFFITPTSRRFCRPNINLANNERIVINRKYFSIIPKLIWRQTAPYLICTIDYRGVWFGRSLQSGIIKSEYENKISYEYLCGLLNSKYLRYLYEQNVKESGRVYPQVKLEKVKLLPIAFPSKKQMLLMDVEVMDIINRKKINPSLDITHEKQEIDNLVYSLYDLTYEEVLIVEPEFKERMSKVEYEKFKKENKDE